MSNSTLQPRQIIANKTIVSNWCEWRPQYRVKSNLLQHSAMRPQCEIQKCTCDDFCSTKSMVCRSMTFLVVP